MPPHLTVPILCRTIQEVPSRNKKEKRYTVYYLPTRRFRLGFGCGSNFGCLISTPTDPVRHLLVWLVLLAVVAFDSLRIAIYNIAVINGRRASRFGKPKTRTTLLFDLVGTCLVRYSAPLCLAGVLMLLDL